ncbi:hypothetical protein D9758_009239 [Tetrapyrgos nigripes]|uniref:Uncharacterized protein n=1 Tax=Tetrapyrgos nigripes TaxID=182062 RepID=A0A8H5D236_9AGAR|nr:hypothetical protein D9758_009239 [Tetrapyrgos nigripes]
MEVMDSGEEGEGEGLLLKIFPLREIDIDINPVRKEMILERVEEGGEARRVVWLVWLLWLGWSDVLPLPLLGQSSEGEGAGGGAGAGINEGMNGKRGVEDYSLQYAVRPPIPPIPTPTHRCDKNTPSTQLPQSQSTQPQLTSPRLGFQKPQTPTQT